MSPAPSAPALSEPLVGIGSGRRFFPELEALRGIAILLVFFFHADGMLEPTLPSGGIMPTPFRAWIELGAVGVDLFFILSGFLLSLPFLEAARGGPPVSITHYFERRALRILPMWWLAVAVATIVSTRVPEQLLWGVPYLFFADAFGFPVHALLPHSLPWWSLVTEVQFYLVLPIVGLLLCSRAGRWGLLALVVVWIGAYVAVLSRVGGLTMTTKIALVSNLFGRAPLFAFGMLAAWVHLRWGESIRARLAVSHVASTGVADLMMLALVWAGGTLLAEMVFVGIGGQLVRFRPLWHIGAGVVLTAILLVLLLAPLRTRALWVNPLLCRVGVLSYSLYLIHLWPLDVALARFRTLPPAPPNGWTLPATLTVLAVLAACLGLSELTYRFVERPFLVRKARAELR